MYFSVITVAEHAIRQAAYELNATPYAMHQWLWKFFPDRDGQSRDFIFRHQAVEKIPRFYVVSQHRPVSFSEAWQVQSRSYDPQLPKGQRLSFHLCANPVVSKKSATGKSLRHDVVMQAKKQILLEHGLGPKAKWRDIPIGEDKPALYDLVQQHCVTWLQSRASNHGFEVITATVDAYRQHKTNKKGFQSSSIDLFDDQNVTDNGTSVIKFSSVDFLGELRVTDDELFRQVLFNGLGHAKAFGCGMLLVKRIEKDA